MPIYIYECGECGDTREYNVSMIGQRPERCQECDAHGDRLTRVYDGQTLAVGGSGQKKGMNSLDSPKQCPIYQLFERLNRERN